MKNSISNKVSAWRYAGGKHISRLTGFSLLTIVICISCGSLPKNHLPSDASTRPVSWFKADTGHILFNTSIKVMKNRFTGLTVVKTIDKGNHRVIMITETGLKILDMEFFPDTLPKVHYIMEQMNRKVLVKMLQNDISLMLMNHVQDVTPVWYENFIVNPGKTALFRVNNEKHFYLLEPGEVHPFAALVGKGRRFKTEVHFFGTEVSGIDSLKLSQKNLDLSIRLARIHELK